MDPPQPEPQDGVEAGAVAAAPPKSPSTLAPPNQRLQEDADASPSTPPPSLPSKRTTEASPSSAPYPALATTAKPDVALSTSEAGRSSIAATSTSGYGGLAYAPRQRNMGSFRGSAAFQSHSSQFQSESAMRASASTSSLLQPPPALDDSGAGASASGSRRPTQAAMSLLHQKMKADAQAMGLDPQSLGWALLEKFRTSNDGEWASLASMLARGEATLLLPRYDVSMYTTGPITLAAAYDHILLSESRPPRPQSSSSSSDAHSKEQEVVTLSGLRGRLVDGVMSLAANLEMDKDAPALDLELLSFIPREGTSFVAELCHPTSRDALCSSLAPLPGPCSDVAPMPRVGLGHFRADFSLPRSASQPSTGNAPAASRPRAGSRGSQGGLTVDSDAGSRKASNRASTTFAQLFGGGARERHPAQPGYPAAMASPSGGELKELYESGASQAKESQVERYISVWVTDRPIRRGDVMQSLREGLEARLRDALGGKREGHEISPAVLEVISSFASMFLPPVRRQGLREPSKSASNESDLRSPSFHVASAPYLGTPDELSDSFQDFFSSIRAQIEMQRPASPGPEAGSAEAQAPSSEDVDACVEDIERALTYETYDRIFSPFTSGDSLHDESLASRIAALNLMGLSLGHLGLLIPEDGDEGKAIREGIDAIVSTCGRELQRLGQPSCRSPKEKLQALVAAHRAVVEGLGKLPRIELKDEAEQGDEGAKAASDADPTSSPPPKPKSNTSSADLILPILIYSIVKSNPPQLSSHLLFIQRFRAGTLLGGEASYCLVNVQAAVAFLENVEPKALGLAGTLPSVKGGSIGRRQGQVDSRAVEALNSQGGPPSMPVRIRGRMVQEIGELAGMSNRVITGVMGTSLSAFSRMMGASGFDTFEKGRLEGPKTLEEIKNVLSGSGRMILTRSGSSGNLKTAAKAEEDAPLSSPVSGTAPVGTARPVRVPARRAAPTDYGEPENQVADRELPEPIPRDKLSISDRLASLPMMGRFGMGGGGSGTSPLLQPQALSASPGAVNRELPGPPPPQKTGRLRTHSNNSVGTQAPVSPLAPAFAPQEPIPASLQSPYAPLRRPPTSQRPLHVVLASTGSVASVKIPFIVESLMMYDNVRVQVVASANSMHFYDPSSIAKLARASHEGDSQPYTVAALAAENKAAVRGSDTSELLKPRAHLWTDKDEWGQWEKIGDPILHIELRRWADIVLVAPCSANTLAKINGGICDSLLTSFLRALSPSTPTILFPAMNTLMYLHPLTSRQLDFARDVLGYEIMGPIAKRLACGDLGQGAMLEWTDIVGLLVDRFGLVPAQDAGRQPSPQPISKDEPRPIAAAPISAEKPATTGPTGELLLSVPAAQAQEAEETSGNPPAAEALSSDARLLDNISP